MTRESQVSVASLKDECAGICRYEAGKQIAACCLMSL
jgi:hypothetical protein